MKKNDLTTLIGMDVPTNNESSTVMQAISAILCGFWKSEVPKPDENSVLMSYPIIFEPSKRLEENKFYFDLIVDDPNLATQEFIILSLEASLTNLDGIADVIVQGNSILIQGDNQKSFSLTVFEISCEDQTTSWLINTSISER